jgi:predicted  nucleic acid-binding Zn-ribbon protein
MATDLADRQTAVEELERRVDATRGQLSESDERLRKFQRAVQAGRATLKRLEARGQEVANMQQHLAVRHEADVARSNLRAAEEDALDTLQEAERLGQELEGLEAELGELRGDYERRRGAMETRTSELQEQLAIRRDQRHNREVRLDARVLQMYEKVRKGGSDNALAPLTGDGVCGHCYTSVPIQKQSDIRTGRALAVCEGCGIILYAPTE